jgi:hypothetical protein
MHSNIPNTGPETKGLTSGRLDPSLGPGTQKFSTKADT